MLLGLLFAGSLFWRLTYLHRLSASPLAESLNADARVYWDWAGWLMHRSPVGSQPFFLGPLYPYVLALMRAVTGDSMPAVLAIEAVWGAATVILLADTVRRIAGWRIGIIIGVLLGANEMMVFFDGLILSESLLLFLGALLVWWIAWFDWTQPPRYAFAGIGCLVGLLAAGRATGLLLMVPCLLGILPLRWPLGRASWLGSLTALAACAIVILPIAVRNYVVGGELIPITYNAGYNLYVGNNPDANGASVSIVGVTSLSTSGRIPEDGSEIDGRDYLRRTGNLSLSPLASSRYWSDAAWRYIAAHRFETLRLMLTKLGMLWNRREYSQIERVQEYREWAGPVGLPWLGSFALLGLLSIAGV